MGPPSGGRTAEARLAPLPFLLAVALLWTPHESKAQDPRPEDAPAEDAQAGGVESREPGFREVRRGFWLEATAGTGTVRNTCAGCETVSVGFGSAYTFRVGAALNDRVHLGLEAFTLRSDEFTLGEGTGRVKAYNDGLIPIVLWYVGSSGFFLRGGAGLARGTYERTSASGEPIRARRTGSGVMFGVGFDIPMGRWAAMSANLGTSVTAIGDVDVDGAVVDDVISTIYEFSVGLMLR